MGKNVFIFLCSLYRKKGSTDTTLFFLKGLTTFFWGEVTIDTHESCDSTYFLVVSAIVVPESFDKVDDTVVVGLCTDVEQHDVLGIKKTAEAFEEPQMTW